MADSSFISSGLSELVKGIQSLPEAVTEELKAGAVKIGQKQQATARRLLLEQSQATRTAEAIAVVVTVEEKKVEVISKGVSKDPANNPIWLEFGTIHQHARPYMRPANDETQEEYRKLCESGAERAARKALGG